MRRLTYAFAPVPLANRSTDIAESMAQRHNIASHAVNTMRKETAFTEAVSSGVDADEDQPPAQIEPRSLAVEGGAGLPLRILSLACRDLCSPVTTRRVRSTTRWRSMETVHTGPSFDGTAPEG